MAPNTCLFVLTTVGLLMLLAASLFTGRRRAARPDRAGCRHLWVFHRGPPCWSISLRLATTSVLRI